MCEDCNFPRPFPWLMCFSDASHTPGATSRSDYREFHHSAAEPEVGLGSADPSNSDAERWAVAAAEHWEVAAVAEGSIAERS